jgi:hypothetical protein
VANLTDVFVFRNRKNIDRRWQSPSTSSPTTTVAHKTAICLEMAIMVTSDGHGCAANMLRKREIVVASN